MKSLIRSRPAHAPLKAADPFEAALNSKIACRVAYVPRIRRKANDHAQSRPVIDGGREERFPQKLNLLQTAPACKYPMPLHRAYFPLRREAAHCWRVTMGT